VKVVAGVDVSVKKGISQAAVVLLSFPDLIPLEQKTARKPARFPYVPGFLSFRECPVILAAVRKLNTRPDLVFFDGQGIAHPRRLGIASHAGLLLRTPTIGCAKTRLTGTHEEPGEKAGSFSLLYDHEEVIGLVLRTRDRVKPVFLSIGHRIDLNRAKEYTLSCCAGFRLPEPIRLAHQAAGGREVVKGRP
jgi:deoxyribonuclease V